MPMFTIKLFGLKKNKKKHLLDCMDEFEYFSGSKKSIIKSEKKMVPAPKPTENSLIFSISEVIGRKLRKRSRKIGKISDQIMKKGNPVKEKVYVSVCQHKGKNGLCLSCHS